MVSIYIYIYRKGTYKTVIKKKAKGIGKKWPVSANKLAWRTQTVLLKTGYTDFLTVASYYLCCFSQFLIICSALSHSLWLSAATRTLLGPRPPLLQGKKVCLPPLSHCSSILADEPIVEIIYTCVIEPVWLALTPA